jgi:hypothetical protein
METSPMSMSFEEWKTIMIEIHKEYQEWMKSKSKSQELYPNCIIDQIKRNYILNAPKLDYSPPYASRLATILFKENFKPDHQIYIGLPRVPYHMTTLERISYNDSRERACIQYRKFIRTLQGFAMSYEKSIPKDDGL